MNNFCNIEYLNERLSAVCKERDELNVELIVAKRKIEEMDKETKRLNIENFWLTGGDYGKV